MAEFWNNINFGGKARAEGDESLFKPEYFQKASSNIELLRAVARAGREKSKQLAEAEHGKPKIVLPSWGGLTQAASRSTDSDAPDAGEQREKTWGTDHPPLPSVLERLIRVTNPGADVGTSNEKITRP